MLITWRRGLNPPRLRGGLRSSRRRRMKAEQVRDLLKRPNDASRGSKRPEAARGQYARPPIAGTRIPSTGVAAQEEAGVRARTRRWPHQRRQLPEAEQEFSERGADGANAVLNALWSDTLSTSGGRRADEFRSANAMNPPLRPRLTTGAPNTTAHPRSPSSSQAPTAASRQPCCRLFRGQLEDRATVRRRAAVMRRAAIRPLEYGPYAARAFRWGYLQRNR